LDPTSAKENLGVVMQGASFDGVEVIVGNTNHNDNDQLECVNAARVQMVG